MPVASRPRRSCSGSPPLAFAAFASQVHDALHPSGRHDGPAAIAWCGVTLLIGGWALSYGLAATVALYSDRLSDDSIFLGMVAYGAAAAVGGIGLSLMLGAYALAAHREAVFPAWTTAVAGVGALVNIGGLATYTTDSSTVFAFLYLGFGAFVVWIIGVSVSMLRSAPGATTVRAVGAAA